MGSWWQRKWDWEEEKNPKKWSSNSLYGLISCGGVEGYLGFAVWFLGLDLFSQPGRSSAPPRLQWRSPKNAPLKECEIGQPPLAQWDNYCGRHPEWFIGGKNHRIFIGCPSSLWYVHFSDAKTPKFCALIAPQNGINGHGAFDDAITTSGLNDWISESEWWILTCFVVHSNIVH